MGATTETKFGTKVA